MTRQLTYHLTAKQTSAYRLLSSPDDCAVLFGGAKGGAKTFLLCLWTKLWVEHLIHLFDLQPSDTPIAIGWIGRKRAVNFYDTTLETFKRIIPSDHYRLHDSEHEIIFDNRAKIFCGGLDDSERIEKFNSAEFAFFAIDQAEETERTDVDVLQATLRLKVNGLQPPYKQLYTANPADCWLKDEFIDNRRQRRFFVPATHHDNPHLPSNYVQTLEDAFRYNEGLLRAYRDGDWYALQAANVLISSLMLQNLKGIVHHPTEIRRVVACDPSLGGDECVIQALENERILEQVVLHERDTMKIAGHMHVLASKYAVPHYATDTTGGLGQGINDRLRELTRRQTGTQVFDVNAASSAQQDDRFANLRAEMWWWLMGRVQERMIPYPEDEELRRQLTATRFKVVNSNGRILLEPKADTRKHLGRSPDRADAYVLGCWALSQTQPIKPKDGWRDEPDNREVHSTVTSAMAA